MGSSLEENYLIEYARFHGLARDHTIVQPLTLHGQLHPLPEKPHHVTSLYEIPRPVGFTEIERLSVSKEAAHFLSSICKPGKWQPPDLSYERPAWDLKLELPLLRSDNELDLESFGGLLEPTLADSNIPFEIVEASKDEDVQWPLWVDQARQELNRGITSEKLDVSKDTLKSLQAFIKPCIRTQHEIESSEIEIEHRKPLIELVTPPLLPCSPVFLPFVPSSSPVRLEPLSDRTSPTAAQLEAVDKSLAERDSLCLTGHAGHNSGDSPGTLEFETRQELGQLYSPLRQINDFVISPPKPRLLGDAHKVEGPLTPLASDDWKGVKERPSFHEALKNTLLSPLKPVTEPDEDKECVDTFFQSLSNLTGEVERNIEQEQLTDTELDMRVTVPVLDFVLPTPPWAADSQDPHEEKTARLGDAILGNSFWPGANLVATKVPWNPLPGALQDVGEHEELLEDDSFLSYAISTDMNVTLDSSGLVWKPEGLRMVKEGDEGLEDDEEDLEVGHFEPQNDIRSLLKKRELQLEDDEGDTSGAGALLKGHDGPENGVGESPLSHDGQFQIPSGSSLLGGMFSASHSLANFLIARGGPVKKPRLETVSHHFSPAVERADLPALDAIESCPETQNIPSEPVHSEPVPHPSLAPPPERCTFIFSSTLLTQRHLTSHIKSFYTTACIVERDFSAFPSHPSTTGPKLSDEADISISPSTGLIWTTMPQIRQRSLPGQPIHAPVQDRIWRVGAKYERLIVLVSEGRTSDGPARETLNSYECAALNELQISTLGRGDDVQVIYVPGGEMELAQWMVASMVKYALRDENYELLEETTLWELFLREAGMNAWAAQYVLAQLRAPEEGMDARDWGLRRFMVMDQEERVARFEGVCGAKVLRRVECVIDGGWQAGGGEMEMEVDQP